MFANSNIWKNVYTKCNTIIALYCSSVTLIHLIYKARTTITSETAACFMTIEIYVLVIYINLIVFFLLLGEVY